MDDLPLLGSDDGARDRAVAAAFGRKRTWRTRDGQTILVADMSDSHLDRAISLCERTWASNPRYPDLLAERRRRVGDWADTPTDNKVVVVTATKASSPAGLVERARHRDEERTRKQNEPKIVRGRAPTLRVDEEV